MLLDRTTPHVLQHTARSPVGGSFDEVSEPERLARKNRTQINLTNDYEQEKDEVRAVKGKHKKAEQLQKFDHIFGPSPTL